MHRSRGAFTLVEVLAALALAGLLLAALLGVAARLRAVPVSSEGEGWSDRQRLTDMLWRDLAQAGSVRQEDGVLRLTSWHALPASSEPGTPRQLPVTVVYEIVAGERMVLRHQQRLTGQAEPWSTEIVGWGIAELSLLERDEEGVLLGWLEGEDLAHIGFGAGRVLQVRFSDPASEGGGGQ